MIIDVWSWTLKAGKGQEARDWIKQHVQYHSSQGINARTLSPVNGSVHKTFFEAEFESLAAMEKYWGSQTHTEALKDLSKGAEDLIVEDSIQRHQFRVD